MNDNDIYKIAYNTIKQAIEWGTNKDLSVQFAQYTEGVIEFYIYRYRSFIIILQSQNNISSTYLLQLF